jgi:hypothetical protein
MTSRHYSRRGRPAALLGAALNYHDLDGIRLFTTAAMLQVIYQLESRIELKRGVQMVRPLTRPLQVAARFLVPDY